GVVAGLLVVGRAGEHLQPLLRLPVAEVRLVGVQRVRAGAAVLHRARLVAPAGRRDGLVDLLGTLRDLGRHPGGVLELVDLLLERGSAVTRLGEPRLLGVVQVALGVWSVRDQALDESVALLQLLLQTPDHGVVGVAVHSHGGTPSVRCVMKEHAAESPAPRVVVPAPLSGAVVVRYCLDTRSLAHDRISSSARESSTGVISGRSPAAGCADSPSRTATGTAPTYAGMSVIARCSRNPRMTRRSMERRLSMTSLGLFTK